MTTTSMNISLTQSLKTEVENRITEGKFSNSNDYIRQGVGKKEKELKALLLSGLNSGISEKTTEEVFSDLRNYIKSKV